MNKVDQILKHNYWLQAGLFLLIAIIFVCVPSESDAFDIFLKVLSLFPILLCINNLLWPEKIKKTRRIKTYYIKF